MDNLIYKIRCTVLRLLPETSDQKKRKEILRKHISELPETPFSEDSWTKFRNKVRLDILRKDPRTFLSWPDILYTMFHRCRPIELTELKQKSYWNQWESSLTENKIGAPRRYPNFKKSSGNLIHHAYSLSKLYDYQKIDFSKLNTIIEFGGGYGSMARLIYNLGFRGTYISFDLPEFLAIQEYYLGSLGINNVKYVDSVKNLKDVLKSSESPELFIATWSLSESPTAVREEFLNALPYIKYFLVGFRDSFDGIDNNVFLKNFTNNKKENSWKFSSIPHLPGNNYLLGKPKQ